MEKKDKDAVVFRKDPDGTVVALFPNLPANVSGYYCTCFQHVGQHGSADYGLVVSNTKPATPAEYEALKTELEGRGYVLCVYTRRPR